MKPFGTGNSSDKAVLLRHASGAAQGHQEAFDELYSMTAQELFGTAFICTGDVADAALSVARSYGELLATLRNGEVDVFPFLLASVIRSMQDKRSDAEPTPVDVRDAVAAQTLAALKPHQRCALWLVEVLKVPLAVAASAMVTETRRLREHVSLGRADFRSSYVTLSEGNDPDSEECKTTRPLLVSYSGRKLNAGNTFAVEQHLANCQHCRTTVSRLDDLDSRLRHAIPAMPAWLHQLSSDELHALQFSASPLLAIGSGEQRSKRHGLDVKAFIGAAALTAVLGFGALSAFSGNTQPVAQEAPTTTSLASSTTTIAALPSIPTPAAPAALPATPDEVTPVVDVDPTPVVSRTRPPQTTATRQTTPSTAPSGPPPSAVPVNEAPPATLAPSFELQSAPTLPPTTLGAPLASIR